MITSYSRRVVGGALAVSALVGLSACGSSGSHSAGSVAPVRARLAAADAVSSAQNPTATAPNTYAAASKVVDRLGYDPSTAASAWHSDHHLNAIVGILKKSADGKYQRTFFFVDGRYIGTDTAKPSADIGVKNTAADLVTASYGIFQPSDALCCPSSHRSVRYEWNGSKLVPLDPIPPVATNTTAGR